MNIKILHLADLHFGKMFHNISLIESGDQTFWVDRALEAIAREKPNAVVISGDVYDRGVPSREAVQLLSRFLSSVSDMGIPVMLIAGNHDGGERLEFAADILARSNVHIAGTVQKTIKHVTLEDEHGEVTFWLMPYIFPAAVRDVLPETEKPIDSYTDAIRALVREQAIDFSKRNVILAHQTVLHGDIEPEHSASETAIGGVGHVDVSVFDGFDYVALGHIHGAQKVCGDHIRYAGSPLCYHFDEWNQKKGLLWVTLNEKNTPLAFAEEVVPVLHRVRKTMTGTLEEIEAAEEKSRITGEYVRVELKGRTLPSHAAERLRDLFNSHGCRLLDIVRIRESRMNSAGTTETERELSPEEYFARYYEIQTNGETLSEKDVQFVHTLAQQIHERPDEDEEKLIRELVRNILKQEGATR